MLFDNSFGVVTNVTIDPKFKTEIRDAPLIFQGYLENEDGVIVNSKGVSLDYRSVLVVAGTQDIRENSYINIESVNGEAKQPNERRVLAVRRTYNNNVETYKFLGGTEVFF